MITITILKNPFNLDEKEIHTCEYAPGKTAYEYIQPHIMGLDDFVVSVSGNIAEDAKARLVNSGDWIAVCPVVGKGGRDWLRAFASIVLQQYILSPIMNAILPGKSWFMSALKATAVNMIGGALINHWFPPPKVDRPNVDAKAAYNWRSSRSLTGQGNALAMTYGTMRTAGQVVAQHVSSNGENQYLNILLCGGEGPIDDISDIRINDNPVSYYKDMTFETRLGTNDQTAIANFNDVYNDHELAYELNTDNQWIAEQTTGSAVEGLEVTLQFPYGLYYMNDDSSLGSASVSVQLQYRKVGDEGWINLTGASSITISAATNTAFQRTYRVDYLPASKYEVRALCISKSGTSTRYSTRVFWTQLSSITYDDFARPGKVLVGIKALATSQLSGGTPSITWVQTRSKVWVWNPNSTKTEKYEEKDATNPAWAAYDMIHRCRKIKNIHTGNFEYVVQGEPASRAVYNDFANWAAFCDSRNLTFNYIFNTATDLWTALQKPGGVGRGRVIMRGTRYGCVCDAPGQPVQLFTVGNIITDKFKESFVSLKERANAVEISFVNKDKGYEMDYITAYADDYDATTEPNITQITLDGATTVAQAYREAKYRLRVNQHLKRTVEHSADIDAIACQINDVVLLAHDVPQWGFSGRLLDATATTLKLDREVTLEAGKAYAIAVQITNPAATTPEAAQSIATIAVQGVAQETTTDTLTLANAVSTVPQRWDLYSFGEMNRVVKPFRVLNISRDQDLRRKITCIEYVEEIYTEATVIPEISYSALEATPEVSSVSVAEETYRQKDGTMISNLNVSWKIPRDRNVRGYKVYYSSNNGASWTEWGSGTKALSTCITGVLTKTTYLVKVCTINDVSALSDGVVSPAILVTGKDVPPSNVASLSASLDPADLTKVNLSWTPVADVDLAGYRIREGAAIVDNLAQMNSCTYAATENREHVFRITAVDNSGNESEIPATTIITPVIYPATPNGFTAVQNGDVAYLYWNKNSATDIAGYEIREGALFDNASLVSTGITGIELSVPVSSERTYRYHIKAINKAGKASQEAATAEVRICGLPPKNVIFSFDEMTARSGTHTNTEFGASYFTCLTLPGRCSDYTTRQCNQAGGSVVLKLQAGQTAGEYLAARKDLGGLTKVNLAVDFISTALLSGGNEATLYYRHSRDGSSFEDWKVFMPVTLTTRFIDFKAALAASDQNYPIEVGTFTESVDVDDVEKEGNETIAIGGSTVSYGNTFFGGSGPNNTPVFIPTAIGAGLRAEVVSAGLSSAVVKVVNAVTGADAGGTINFRVKGYGGQ